MTVSIITLQLKPNIIHYRQCHALLAYCMYHGYHDYYEQLQAEYVALSYDANNTDNHSLEVCIWRYCQMHLLLLPADATTAAARTSYDTCTAHYTYCILILYYCYIDQLTTLLRPLPLSITAAPTTATTS